MFHNDTLLSRAYAARGKTQVITYWTCVISTRKISIDQHENLYNTSHNGFFSNAVRLNNRRRFNSLISVDQKYSITFAVTEFRRYRVVVRAKSWKYDGHMTPDSYDWHTRVRARAHNRIYTTLRHAAHNTRERRTRWRMRRDEESQSFCE